MDDVANGIKNPAVIDFKIGNFKFYYLVALKFIIPICYNET